ncbi:ER membrane protein DP1/Yop1 [Coemansia aciculifera]|uniref:ER membrane protein DP1/Yop1 n=1 Tax=Coemansia aciculifera TaxID=417176 RepID=A0ACC1LU54_9FUNG|nr:ER membrane protein DP1/Yop1 [Coemansia aciculifera]KAJ2909844.1 ER membrane protein DP1/Yop1 [Coemansia aciculifera]
MEQARQVHDKYFEQADRALSCIPLARTFEAKTGVPKVYGGVGVATLVFSLVFFNIGAPLLVNLTGFGYAAYASFEAIESPGKEDDVQWLTYWVVYGLCNVVEYFTGMVTYWIPFYYVFKLGFLVWLMMPATRGAERLYVSTIKPIAAHVKTMAKNSATPAAPATSSSASAAAPPPRSQQANSVKTD